MRSNMTKIDSKTNFDMFNGSQERAWNSEINWGFFLLAPILASF